MAVGGKREGAGRKPGAVSASTLAIRTLANEHSSDAMQTLVDLSKDEATPAASRVAAIKEILERAHGKSASFITATFDPPLSSQSPADALASITDKLTDGDLPVEDAAKLSGLTESRMKAQNLVDIEDRLKALEGQTT